MAKSKPKKRRAQKGWVPFQEVVDILLDEAMDLGLSVSNLKTRINTQSLEQQMSVWLVPDDWASMAKFERHACVFFDYSPVPTTITHDIGNFLQLKPGDDDSFDTIA